VYQIPTENEESFTNSAYTLQRLFYQLQTSDDAVSTNELTKSFGWETRHIFEQQDVQELSRKLMERMEERMKGTEAENSLAKLFVGKTKTYVSCINVEYESSRVEDFWDIQLNVSGNKNLDDSFKDYVQVETMEGENKYFAEGHGLQDAKKGVIFESFPSVLHLQLKRFEYDINRDAMMKVNDRYEFPETFDASPYLSDDADKSESYVYQLHGVLVHSGDFNAGHYYAFLKPTNGGPFFKFDDDRVTRATQKEIFEENFGGEYPLSATAALNATRNPYTRTLPSKRSMSAYMLVYLRQSRLHEILPDVTETDCPAHLKKRLDEERALAIRKRKEREEQHLYLQVKVISDLNFIHHQGFDLATWEQDAEDVTVAPRSYRTLKAMTVGEFSDQVAKDLNVESGQVRVWVMVNRQNKTVRPDQPLVDPEMTMEEAQAKHGTRTSDFRLWIEVAELGESGNPSWPDTSQPQNPPILVFLKYFDPETQTLRGSGHVYVRKNDKVSELFSSILASKKWPTNTQVKLFEEIKPSMIELMKPKQSLNQAEIQDGDIVCFQKVLSDKESAVLQQKGNYIDAREFYDHLLNRIMVKFSPVPEADQSRKLFELELGKKMSYDQLSAKVGEYLGVDPTHLRFYTVNATTGARKQAVRRQVSSTLQQILAPPYGSYATSQHTSALYFEILDLSLSELETMKKLKVVWLTEGISKEVRLKRFLFEIILTVL
jgi:ubiquitin carboxyl-terminal hydrolase 7